MKNIEKTATAIGGAAGSMNRWCSELIQATGAYNEYVHDLLKEEAAKPARLARALAVAGLKPHPQYRFCLPTEKVKLIKACQSLERDGYLISIRIFRTETGTMLYRVLDSDARTVEADLCDLDPREPMLATVTSDRHPDVSGTLLVRDGDALMEMVHGPHHWLTKTPPTGMELLRCWFTFPHLSIKYSTSESAHREMLFRHLKAVIRITFGIRLGELATTSDSVYAEFQWDSHSGYRFFELSYSWVWTGSLRDRF